MKRLVTAAGFFASAFAAPQAAALRADEVPVEEQWKALLKTPGKFHTAKSVVLKLCRRGIPPELRPQVWPLLCHFGTVDTADHDPDVWTRPNGVVTGDGAQREIGCGPASREAYLQIVKQLERGELVCAAAENIQVDLEQQCSPFPVSPDLTALLHRVLSVYTLYMPYHRDMCFIAYVIALGIQALEHDREPTVFFCLDRILKGSLYLKGVHADDSVREGIFFALRQVLLHQCYEVQQKFDGHGLRHPHLYASSWILRGWADLLPLPLVLRVWDRFLVEGIAVFFCLGAAVVQIQRPQLLRSISNMRDFGPLTYLGGRQLCAVFSQQAKVDLLYARLANIALPFDTLTEVRRLQIRHDDQFTL